MTIATRVNLPEWWISAGVIRDLVWDRRFNSAPGVHTTKDIDLGFFDPADPSPERDQAAETSLRSFDPTLPWDAKNQAAVHLWYPLRFGIAVAPFTSAEEAVSTFPEYATCVAVRTDSDGRWDVAAPYGLDDLLDGVWRRNPTRVTAQEYLARLDRKQPQRLWPAARVVVSADPSERIPQY